jgi:hypothetical protein
MKTLIAVAVVLFAVQGYAQDVDTVLTVSVFQDTLASTVDTMVITTNRAVLGLDEYSIVAYTTTGTDTVLVSTLAANGATWAQVALLDESSGSAATSIIVTTTPKEFTLYGSPPSKIRLIASGVSSSCVVILSGKRIYPRR